MILTLHSWDTLEVLYKNEKGVPELNISVHLHEILPWIIDVLKIERAITVGVSPTDIFSFAELEQWAKENLVNHENEGRQ